MRSIVLLCLSISLTCISAAIVQLPEESSTYGDLNSPRQLFKEFKQKYGKTYSNDDDKHRFKIFKNNLKLSKLYQSLEQGTAKYGITQFFDLTAEEFQKFYLNTQLNQHTAGKKRVKSDNLPDAPSSFDWRNLGAVGPVWNQGMCASCWAFSTIGNVEGQWYLKTGKLYQLSEQQLVDCDKVDAGCNGGLPMQAYEALNRMGGVNTAEDYPYRGISLKCNKMPTKFVAYVNDSVQLTKDEKVIAQWLAQNGPLSVALNANLLQYYTGGITHPFSFLCPASGLNHAVLLVGYGEENGKPYWIVKNSWGISWGESGYFRIYRGDGCCGINEMVTSAIIH